MTEGDQEKPAEARPLDFRFWRGFSAAASVAILGIIFTVAVHPPSAEPSRYVAAESVAPPETSQPPDPLMVELIRCRALLEEHDVRCRAAWEENRRRFFGESRAMRVPGDPLPAYARIPSEQPASTQLER